MGPHVQSAGQVKQVSVASQKPFPQKHAPQSAGQVSQPSLPLQAPSPQTGGHTPQSVGQVLQVSVPLQVWSPQTGGHTPQSPGQVLQVSLPLQVWSPQMGGHTPQSAGQVLHVSVPLQTPFPQPRVFAADLRASIFSLTGEVLAVTASGVFGVCAPAKLTPIVAAKTRTTESQENVTRIRNLP